MSVAGIVDDVRARGGAAVAEWALRLDGAEPARAVPEGEVPAEALLALADAVRRWHESQRPADVQLEIAPGVELHVREDARILGNLANDFDFAQRPHPPTWLNPWPNPRFRHVRIPRYP